MSHYGTESGISPSTLETLEKKALQSADHAYAPYSGFRVGAALLLESGEIVEGCNVENASYRLTTCAEQTAISSAVARFGPDLRIRAIVIVNLNNEASQPCGACRQTIGEFSGPATEVFFPDGEGSLTRLSMAELLPHAFSFLKK